MARLDELAAGGEITAANAFFSTPLVVALHILADVPFSILGALQFAPAFRRRRPDWHRASGGALVLLGLIRVLGLWMAYLYPWPQGDGELLIVARLVSG
jgi:hypothetical protein